jgi:hypothetical protein
MAKLCETQSPALQLRLAAQTRSPFRLAQTFAAFVGQFYDRESFDTLARQVSGMYDADHASTFRAQLDRRLHDRYHTPVAWEVTPQIADRAA